MEQFHSVPDNHDGQDEEHGYRMICMVVRDRYKPGGMDLLTILVCGTMEICQQEVNKLLEKHRYEVFGWKITNLLPIVK